MAILVTGATGNVGAYVIEALLAKGVTIKALARTPSKLADVAAKGVEVVAGDLSDPSSLLSAFKGVTAVFLNVAIADDMVQQHQNAVDAAKANGVRSIVKLSVMGTEYRHYKENLLYKQHVEGEDIVKGSGLAFTILRPNAFMQNFTIYDGNNIRSQGAFYNIAGKGKLSFIDLRDIAEVAAQALTNKTHDGKTYSLSGAEAYTFDKAAELLTEITGKEVKYVNITEEGLRSAMAGYGLPQFYIDCITDLYSAFAQGWHSLIVPELEVLLGRPPITLKDSLTEQFGDKTVKVAVRR